MQAIETAWKNWFGKFAPYVFTDSEMVIGDNGEYIQDPNNVLYPRITFTYMRGTKQSPGNVTFQIWTWSHNNAQLWDVSNKISEHIGPDGGQKIELFSVAYFEYQNPITKEWFRFESASDFQEIVERFPGYTVQWHKIEGESLGGFLVWRTGNWMQPSPKPQALSRVYYSVIQMNDWTII